MAPDSKTFLQRYVDKNVCSHKGSMLMPIVPAILMANIFDPLSFFAVWGIVIFVWLIVWLGAPCNPNLNCNSMSQKDGTKAFVVSFLMVYGILFGVAVAARFFICDSGKPKQDRYGGGILENIGSLFGYRSKLGGEKPVVAPRSVKDRLLSFSKKPLGSPVSTKPSGSLDLEIKKLSQRLKKK